MRNPRSLLAAALTLGALLGAAACASGQGGTLSGAGPASSAAGPAGAPSGSASAPSGSASAPAAGALVPACVSTQLAITLIRRGIAVTGQIGGYLRFTNTGSSACRLHGWPEVTAVTASGRVIAAVRAVHGTMLGAWQDTSPLPVIRLAHGAAAYAVLAAGDQPAGRAAGCQAVRLLRVTLPAAAGQVTLTARLYDHVYLPACTSASGATEVEFSAIVPLSDLAPR